MLNIKNSNHRGTLRRRCDVWRCYRLLCDDSLDRNSVYRCLLSLLAYHRRSDSIQAMLSHELSETREVEDGTDVNSIWTFSFLPSSAFKSSTTACLFPFQPYPPLANDAGTRVVEPMNPGSTCAMSVVA